MPELPEVEAWRRAVDRWTVGCRVHEVVICEPTSVRAKRGTRPVPPAPQLLARLTAAAGQSVGATARHGKRMGWRFGEAWWSVHLGMTGRFERCPSSHPPPDHARVGWRLDDGHTVWFRDARRFGAVVPLEGGLDSLAEALGPDALMPLSGPQLAARFRGRRALKVALLDQGALAGLGNIHAAEALWRARLAPTTPVSEVGDEGWGRLARAIPVQLEDALADIPEVDAFVYVTDGGDNPFAVYGREGSPCPRCQQPVQRSVQGGRSTFWCAGCQPSPS